jgi:hypothetical protein
VVRTPVIVGRRIRANETTNKGSKVVVSDVAFCWNCDGSLRPQIGVRECPGRPQGVNVGWRLDLLFAYCPHCGASLGIVSAQQT